MKDKEGTRQYAIYSRKSRFTGKGESVANQIEDCRREISRMEGREVSLDEIRVYEDEGFSGKDTNRPRFQEMLADIHAGKIKTVLCYRLDRISRNTSDFYNTYNELCRCNVDFVSVSEHFDTTTPGGRAMLGMCSIFAQMERETIAERIRDNMLDLAKTGRWLGGVTPTGYKSIEMVGSYTVDGRERKAHKLEPIPEEAKIIQLIFAKFLESNSQTYVRNYLRENNIKTKGGKEYQRFSVKTILENPVYAVANQAVWEYFQKRDADIYSPKEAFDGKHGIMAYNKTEQSSGKSNVDRDISEWIIAVGKHKGLIPGEDWVRVQRMIQANASPVRRKPRSNVALLSGLLYCGDCGGFMRPKLTQRFNKQGERIYDYVCETKADTASRKCNMKRICGNLLDEMICEEIKKLSENPSVFLTELEKAQKSTQYQNEDTTSRLDTLRRERESTEKKITALVSVLAEADGTSAHEHILNQINELDGKKRKIQEETAELERMIQSQSTTDEDFALLRELLVSFGGSFATMTVEQKRAAIRSFIKEIIWDGENVHTVLFGCEEEQPVKKGNSNFDSVVREGMKEPLTSFCKRNPDALPQREKDSGRRVHQRPAGRGWGWERHYADGRLCG